MESKEKMKLFYGFRKKYGLYYAVVWHWSNINEDEVFDYYSRDSFEYSSQAIDAAKEWADIRGLEVEMEP